MPALPSTNQPSANRPAPEHSPRPRGADGRALNDRPRDGLGRPLPHGEAGVPRQPEGIARTPEETIALAQALLDAGKPFHAHDVFEDHWKQTSGPERNLWRALAQLAVGITHAARGNIRGAAAVLERAAANLDPYTGAPHQIRTAQLARWARQTAGGLDPESAEPVWLEAPRVRGR